MNNANFTIPPPTPAPDPEMAPFTMSELKILSSALGVVTFLGFYLNFFSAIIIYKLPRFRNAFGVLTVLHAMADSGVAFVFTVWTLPKAFFNIPDDWPFVNLRFGQAVLTCQTIAFHAMFFISFNRFVAITFPSAYRTYFTTTNAYWLIGISLTIAGLYGSLYSWAGCGFYFVSAEIQWYFTETDCSDLASFYFDYIYSVIIFVCVFLMDFNTVFQMRRARSLFATQSNSQTDSREISRRKRREALLVIQACVSSSLYCIGLFNFHIFYNFMATRLTQLLTTNISFGCAHSGGGFVLVIFYPDVRDRLFPFQFFGAQKRKKEMMTTQSVTMFVKSKH